MSELNTRNKMPAMNTLVVQIRPFLKHQRSASLHSVTKDTEKYLGEIKIANDVTDHCPMTSTQKARKMKYIDVEQ